MNDATKTTEHCPRLRVPLGHRNAGHRGGIDRDEQRRRRRIPRRFDRQSGDGDFGTNLTSAFNRVRAEIESTSPATYSHGSPRCPEDSSGPVDQRPAVRNVLPRPRPLRSAARPHAVRTSEGPQRGLATVQRYGKADVGHKTMVDAIAPAAEPCRPGRRRRRPRQALEAAMAAAMEAPQHPRHHRPPRSRLLRR